MAPRNNLTVRIYVPDAIFITRYCCTVRRKCSVACYLGVVFICLLRFCCICPVYNILRGVVYNHPLTLDHVDLAPSLQQQYVVFVRTSIKILIVQLK